MDKPQAEHQEQEDAEEPQEGSYLEAFLGTLGGLIIGVNLMAI